MAVVRVSWIVDELGNVMSLYDTQKVYRSTAGEDGPYTEITDASTRVALVVSQTDYSYDDLLGDAAYWYKVSYFNSTSSLESELSDPIPATGDIDVQVTAVYGLEALEAAVATTLVNSTVTTVRISLRTTESVASAADFISTNGLEQIVISQAGLADTTTFSAYTLISSFVRGDQYYYTIDATVS